MKTKLQLLLTLALGLTSLNIKAQCLTDDFGQYPGPYLPQVCDGVTENVIAEDCWTAEYSLVGLLAGTSYTFSSSLASDLVTISDEMGAVAVAFGFSSVSYTPTASGFYRFYLHNSEACDGDQESRLRIIVCDGDVVNGCLTGSLYPSATFAPTVCDGQTENIIASDCEAGQYTNVNLIGSTLYAFASSTETDFITISDETGTMVLINGIGSVFYSPVANEVVRFYTHSDFACGTEAGVHARIVYCLGSTTGLAGPCVIGDMWPQETFFPTCSGASEAIDGDCWAGEYSAVALQPNTEYTFSSSVEGDWITLTNATGASVYDYGFGPITYTTGFQAEIVRFYSHTDSLCGSENIARERIVQCKNNSSNILENSKVDFKLFPNPASDKVSIEGSVTFEAIEIVAIDGRTLLTITPSALNTEIDVNSLSSGVYFIRVKSNGFFATREFVKY
jgi:hypothetical protein